MTETLSQQTALRLIVAKGIEPILLPANFEAAGRRTWVRREPELLHIVALGLRHGSYAIEWFVVSPEATDFVWGHPPKKADPSDAVMFGTPSGIRQPAACENFELTEQEDRSKIEEMAGLVAQDITTVATWLGQFRTRRQLRSYLLENREPKDFRGFTVPMNLPLKLHIAGVLAVLDRDPAALALADEAEAAWPWSDRLNAERQRRLRAAIAAMGEAGAENG